MSDRAAICNLCQAEVESPLFEWGITRVMKCGNCGFVFRKVAATMSEAELLALTEEVGDRLMSPTAKYDASYREDDSRITMWEEFLARVECLRPHGGKQLLDIGPAKGVFLHVARKRGWQPMGVEPSKSSADYARDTFQIPVFTGTLEEAEFLANRFDLVTMWDVIEHLSNPARTMAEVFRILKPGGMILILTPNHDSLITSLSHWLYRLTFHRFHLEHLLYPVVHLCYFTPTTLSRLLHQCGFRIEGIEASPLHPEKCLVVNSVIRVAASALDLGAKLLSRPYRMVAFASKPTE